MNYILFDGSSRDRLLPFTRTRPVAGLRIGVLTIREKWERFLGAACTCLTAPYLREKFPFTPGVENVLINASLLPDKALAERIRGLARGQALLQNDLLLAAFLDERDARGAEGEFSSDNFLPDDRWRSRNGAGDLPEEPATEGRLAGAEQWTVPLTRIVHPEDIFRLNGAAIASDLELLTDGRKSAVPATTNRILGDQFFLEDGVEMECVNINTRTGPVYIGKGAVVMEGANLRGPLAICDGAVIKMGARLYGPTTIGPGSVAGGEIKQSVIFGNTNKSHDGYLGNSVIGEWCNFGADTNCSNMKNNYRPVKLWSYQTGGMRDTGLPYCGLMMGDFSRTGINTMFNTGSTVGVNVNLYGSAMPPAFVPDFSWGGGDALQPYLLEKALETAVRIKEQKGAAFTEEEARIHAAIFAHTSHYREQQ